MKRLPKEIRQQVDPTLAKATRIHRIPGLESPPLWIKREDELSSGVSGSKLRKYSSLIPYLKANGIDTVAMIGGPNSNNLVGLAQLLRENAIKPYAFVREAADSQLRGNALLLDMLLSPDELQFVPRREWNAVASTAQTFLDALSRDGARTLLLPEGCFGIASLPGAMSLAEDILRNELESKQRFERIYVDCGTGLSAIGLVLGLECLAGESPIQREIVVTLIAETESGFQAKLEAMRSLLAESYGIAVPPSLSLRFLTPSLSPKFGSVNKTLFDACREISRTTGLVMDPTYSVKHYAAARADFENAPGPSASSLFIFNGSALGVLGFQDKLAAPAGSETTPPR